MAVSSWFKNVFNKNNRQEAKRRRHRLKLILVNREAADKKDYYHDWPLIGKGLLETVIEAPEVKGKELIYLQALFEHSCSAYKDQGRYDPDTGLYCFYSIGSSHSNMSLESLSCVNDLIRNAHDEIEKLTGEKLDISFMVPDTMIYTPARKAALLTEKNKVVEEQGGTRI